MTTSQDAAVGAGTETTFKTGVTPTRWFEYVDESIDWNKNVKQGKGLRVGGRVARSGRRVVPSASGGGDLTVECVSKGMGLLWNYALGANSYTLVSGSTYQGVFTLGDNQPSFTVQKTIPHVNSDGTFTPDPITFSGCTVDKLEIDFPNADIVSAKFTIDAADVTTATGYAAASYASTPNLFHFANGTASTGTLTAPTTTALASATTTVADIRGGSLTIDNANALDRGLNIGSGGRHGDPTVGLRNIAGKFDVEYDSTTFRDAVLAETPMCVILTYAAGALSSGLETLQIVLPEVKFDSQIPMTNSTDLVVQSMSFQVLDNLTAAQPLYIVTRSSDAAI
jgi:hypothetical protein